jgi:Na+-driven multidrug efflux pump
MRTPDPQELPTMPSPSAPQDQPYQRPASVNRAVVLLWGLVLVGVVVTVLVVVFRDELAEAWSAGHPPDSAIKQPEFVPVVIVSYVVVAGLILTLVPFLRGGHNWARHSLAATVVFIGITTVAGLRTDPPPVFVACAFVSLAYNAVLLYHLLHRDTSAFVRGPFDPADG